MAKMCCDLPTVPLGVNVSLSHSNSVDSSISEITGDMLGYYGFKNIEEIVDCSSTCSVFIIGASANILTMIIFYRQGLRERMNLCLFCLAFSDLLYLTTSLLTVSYCFIGLANPDQEEFWKVFFIKYGTNFAYGFAMSSGCVTMIIAVERCVCVMFPMKSSSVISTKTMAIILLVTFIVIQLLCSVLIIKGEITVVKDNNTGKEEVILTTPDFYLTNNLFIIVEDIVLPLISILTFTVVCLSTTIIVLKLIKATTWRKNTASGGSCMRSQTMLMRMLVVVCCLYVLCKAPDVALALTRFTVHEFRPDGLYSELFFVTHMTVAIIVMLNSSIHFFVFVTMSSRFRHELKILFTCSMRGISSLSTVDFPTISTKNMSI